jgi:hypothetical protein
LTAATPYYINISQIIDTGLIIQLIAISQQLMITPPAG